MRIKNRLTTCTKFLLGTVSRAIKLITLIYLGQLMPKSMLIGLTYLLRVLYYASTILGLVILKR
jgi:hypothetical protein